MVRSQLCDLTRILSEDQGVSARRNDHPALGSTWDAILGPPKDQRTQSADIFGATCPARGVGAGLVIPCCTTEVMAHRPEEISATAAPGSYAVLPLDQAGSHTTKTLPEPDNITLLPLRPARPSSTRSKTFDRTSRDNWIFQTDADILDQSCDAWNKLIAQPWRIMSIGLPGGRMGHDQ